MATNPRAKTPNDAALSAVEEALRLDFGGPGEDAERERPATRRPPEPRAPDPGRCRSSRQTPRPEAAGSAPHARSAAPARLPRRDEPAPSRGRPPPGGPPSRRNRPPQARRRGDEPIAQPQQPRPRAAERVRNRFAANDDRRPPASASSRSAVAPDLPGRDDRSASSGRSSSSASSFAGGLFGERHRVAALPELAPLPHRPDRLHLGDRHHDLAHAGNAHRRPLDHRGRDPPVRAREHRHRRGGQCQPGDPPRGRGRRRRHRARPRPRQRTGTPRPQRSRRARALLFRQRDAHALADRRPRRPARSDRHQLRARPHLDRQRAGVAVQGPAHRLANRSPRTSPTPATASPSR